MNSADFYDRVKDLVKQKTDLTLSSFLESLEINFGSYSTLRKSDNFPRCDMALKIANALGVSLEYLITGESICQNTFPFGEDVFNFFNDFENLKQDQKDMLLKTFTAQVDYFKELNEKKD